MGRVPGEDIPARPAVPEEEVRLPPPGGTGPLGGTRGGGARSVLPPPASRSRLGPTPSEVAGRVRPPARRLPCGAGSAWKGGC